MSYTDEQMNGIRQAGLDLAPQKEIRMLKNSKQLAYKLEKKELFINKKREREPVVIKEGNNMHTMEEGAIGLIGCADKQVKWDHISQNHNPLTQEDRKKVVVFQQLKAQIDRLQEKRKTADLRLMAKIDEIIAKRSLEIDQCERELKEIEDGNGQNFFASLC